jgi:endogenous inhibitor of DNA gyrase (YacG/DUF329 family)
VLNKPHTEKCGTCGSMLVAVDERVSLRETRMSKNSPSEGRHRCPTCGADVEEPLGFRRLETVR